MVYFWGLALHFLFEREIFRKLYIPILGLILSFSIWWGFFDYLNLYRYWVVPVWVFSGIFLILGIFLIQRKKTRPVYKGVTPLLFMFSAISWTIPIAMISALGVGIALIFKWPIGE
jgi:hypothetical protein